MLDRMESVLSKSIEYLMGLNESDYEDPIGSKLPPTLRYPIRSVGGSLLPNSTERSDVTHSKDVRPLIVK